MNRFCRAIGLVLLAMLLFVAPSHALTLTSNTSISFDNTNFDGLDIEVTNCTVTIDGPHNFSSLHVQNGGIITHTFSSNAVLQSVIHVSGEIQTLSVTNPASLNHSNVFLNTIVVADTNASITYTQDVDYALSTLGNGFTQILLTTNSAIADGSAVSVSYDALRIVPVGVSLVVSNDVQIEAGGAIAANGIGYGGGLGAGAGRVAFTNFPFSFAAGGGGGYGGFGGSSSTAGAGGNCYGDTRFPADAGSGGGAGSGPGGAGGGLIQIIAGGLLRLDGQIAANGGAGTNAHSGGGSGGGIWLSAQNLSGTGLLQANGGAGEPTDGGGGGGGHIAINCLSNAFAGSIGAQGGSGATRGGAGTIFTTTNSLAQTGQLLVDNGGSRGTNTLITISGSYDLMVTGGAIAHGSNSWTFSSLLVGSNSFITHLPTQSLSLVVSGNATIQAGGGIVANAEGYAGGSGLGAGGFSLSAFGSAGGGAGYGGYGGANFTNAAGGLYYGSVAQPTDFGSGGGQGAGSFPGSRGGSGGGSIHLTVAGMLLVDGALTVDAANGIAQGSGGGSGGSLWLQAGQLSGSGIISANGGAGEMPLGGGGSGGRISISEGTNHFTGIISAHGGQGASTGGAGTIYSTVANAPFSQLLVNNGGIHGTNTPLPSPGNNLDLTISGGGSVDAAPVSVPSIHSLLILSNGWVTTTATSRQINLSVSGNVTVFSGGGFVLDGLVPAGTGGTGQGQSGVSPFPSGGGGGHGGYGGVSGFGAAGGNSYDSITAPTLAGSVGGNGTGNSPNNLGGAAGGALQLTVGGGMSFSGIISANGKPGVGQWSGGGSGGSVYITALNFEGSGIISADGGAGDPINGGGGAGGRISINYTSKNFSGSVSAHGGSGTNYGGAGTVYWKSASSSFGQVVLDNGGFPGTNTPLALSSSSDLTISGGAGIFVTTTLPTIGNLVIGSNSFLSFTSPFSPRTITVLSNVTIQAGGGITLDGQGSSQSGTATAISGSGGGYGGYGGNSATNSGGGNSYGSISSPIDLGGAGALRFASSKTAAAGGGALHLTIGGTLTLDGGITARGNGTPGSTSGGGAGGSLWIATGKILGSGLLSADGGAGDLAAGCGGGGGGRIALFFATNQFTGVISAHGGTGLNYGGAGTIYSLASNTFIPLIVVDNGNVRGTNTPLSVLPEQVNLTITGGGQAFALNLPTLIGNLLIGSNSFLIYSNLFGTRSATVTSNATIQAGGGFIMDGMGSAGGSGTAPGQTLNLTGGGGGHGGTGGNSASNALGGIVYDSISGPTGLGSGGGGTILFGSTSPGVGGGAFHLTVNGILALDGAISANGTAGTSSGSGGGSGGSIWLTLGKLSGAGSISANGGSGNLPFGGGGGGGRVAILYNTNQFSGSLFARGGPGANSGGAGTIYLASNKGIQGTNTLIIDNGGTRGATTPFSISGVNLTLGAGSAALVSNSVSFTGLSIASNSVLFSQRAIISVTGNATVQSGGGIVMDGLGSPAGQGPGAGAANFITPYGTTGGGGGYAGYGGNSSFGSAGGNSYGVFDSPTDIGSGGGSGNGTSTNNLGGAGGGSVQLTVTGTLACDGKISADGLPGNGQWSGGGSGGSVLLSAGKITGAGLISANGAPGDLPNGGGGGGGRIAVIFTTNTFSGTIIAHGGVGATGGGAGTIYTRSNSITGSTAQVTLDNAGLRGTNTPLPFASTYGLTVGGGAIGNPAANTTFSSLLINSNGWLSQLRNTNDITFTVSGNAIIRAGGGILANGLIGSLGTGAGGSLNTTSDAWTGGGGGYGGFGAQSVDGATGGNSFGSITQPASVGSAGGGFLPSTFGAPGGGVVNLHVLNNLSVDGQISANGHDAIVEGAGGGSGGSVLLTVGSLSGSGVISANGGNGDVLQGGGGGGGRLAVYYSTNNFTGGISAYGGNGAYFGGAGTVYSKANSSSVSQLVIDNAGDVGTNTPLPSVPTADLFVTGGAVANPTAPLTLNSLLVDSQASMTHLPLSNLDLIVFGNAVIGTNGSVVANGKGYTALNAGPGAGQMPGNNAGSGGGYGGTGGASATGVPGGATYGSAQQPTDLGSSGGYNLAATGFASLSQGGGAVRLRVAGTLTVNGKITANGNDAVYDRSGGGAGGSVWLTASNFAGHGFVTANGGAGEPFDGGGGGGGRIAINSRGNTFSGPIVAFGGFGAAFGNNGSVVITNIPAPQVIAQVPFTVVSYSVSNVDLTFDSPMNPGSVSPSDIVLYTPIGSLPTSSITVTILGLSTFRFNFPPQTTVGYYEIDAGPDIQDFYGLSMADTYIGSFVIASPTISGRVTTTNGTAVAFVTLNAGPTLLPAVTDASGQYELEVPPGWTGTITPSKGNSLFIPAARVYSAVSTDLTNQNFITVSPALLTMHSQLQGANLNLNWFGINGVTYQTLYSTDLINWFPYGTTFIGTNGPVNLLAPVDSAPATFFRFTTSY